MYQRTPIAFGISASGVHHAVDVFVENHSAWYFSARREVLRLQPATGNRNDDAVERQARRAFGLRNGTANRRFRFIKIRQNTSFDATRPLHAKTRNTHAAIRIAIRSSLWIPDQNGGGDLAGSDIEQAYDRRTAPV